MQREHQARHHSRVGDGGALRDHRRHAAQRSRRKKACAMAATDRGAALGEGHGINIKVETGYDPLRIILLISTDTGGKLKLCFSTPTTRVCTVRDIRLI